MKRIGLYALALLFSPVSADINFGLNSGIIIGSGGTLSSSNDLDITDAVLYSEGTLSNVTLTGTNATVRASGKATYANDAVVFIDGPHAGDIVTDTTTTDTVSTTGELTIAGSGQVSGTTKLVPTSAVAGATKKLTLNLSGEMGDLEVGNGDDSSNAITIWHVYLQHDLVFAAGKRSEDRRVGKRGCCAA